MEWPISVKQRVAKERIQRVRFNWFGAILANKPEHTRKNGEISREGHFTARLRSGQGSAVWNAGEKEGIGWGDSATLN
jgi:hypothetical protein